MIFDTKCKDGRWRGYALDSDGGVLHETRPHWSRASAYLDLLEWMSEEAEVTI